MEHKWVEKSLDTIERHNFELSEHVKISLNTVVKIVGVKSLRVCSVCGLESVNGEEPMETCGEAQARQVMES